MPLAQNVDLDNDVERVPWYQRAMSWARSTAKRLWASVTKLFDRIAEVLLAPLIAVIAVLDMIATFLPVVSIVSLALQVLLAACYTWRASRAGKSISPMGHAFSSFLKKVSAKNGNIERKDVEEALKAGMEGMAGVNSSRLTWLAMALVAAVLLVAFCNLSAERLLYCAGAVMCGYFLLPQKFALRAVLLTVGAMQVTTPMLLLADCETQQNVVLVVVLSVVSSPLFDSCIGRFACKDAHTRICCGHAARAIVKGVLHVTMSGRVPLSSVASSALLGFAVYVANELLDSDELKIGALAWWMKPSEPLTLSMVANFVTQHSSIFYCCCENIAHAVPPRSIVLCFTTARVASVSAASIWVLHRELNNWQYGAVSLAWLIVVSYDVMLLGLELKAYLLEYFTKQSQEHPLDGTIDVLVYLVSKKNSAQKKKM